VTPNDEAIAHLKLARDAFYSGNFVALINHIKAALGLLEKDDAQAVDDAALKGLEENK
jgi:hypothetical protein